MTTDDLDFTLDVYRFEPRFAPGSAECLAHRNEKGVEMEKDE